LLLLISLTCATLHTLDKFLFKIIFLLTGYMKIMFSLVLYYF